MIATFGFLLLVSLGVSAALSLLFADDGLVWEAVHLTVSLLVFTLLFAAIYKVLPDVAMPWRTVWTGAALTSVLFSIGKSAIGLYIGRGSVGSSYGAAGSLVVLLVWVYYSCVILFFGAELTQVVARTLGLPLRPNRHAEWEPTAPEAHRA
jgi:membrane protein